MNLSQTQLILASQSSYKRELLERLKIDFETIKPDYEEIIDPELEPGQNALALARGKALSLAVQFNNHNTLILGCDQVAWLKTDTSSGYYLGKPHTLENAHKQLSSSSGNWVHFHTAFYLYNCKTQQSWSDSDLTEVLYRELGAEEITQYLAQEQVLDCAGSAKVEGLGISLLEEVKSTDPTALIGLPLIKVSKALRLALANI